MQINIFGSTFYLCNIYFTKCQVKNQDRIQFFYSEYFFELKKKTELAFCFTHTWNYITIFKQKCKILLFYSNLYSSLNFCANSAKVFWLSAFTYLYK